MRAERAAGGAARVAESPPPAIASDRLLVLVVEDDADSRTIYRTILRISGYSVMETGDGTEGIRLARECRPDVILMDLGIPGTDGWTAIRVLRQGASTARIPVIAITGHAMQEDEQRAREAGCAAFLAKPAAPRVVVAEIRRILNAHARGGFPLRSPPPPGGA